MEILLDHILVLLIRYINYTSWFLGGFREVPSFTESKKYKKCKKILVKVTHSAENGIFGTFPL